MYEDRTQNYDPEIHKKYHNGTPFPIYSHVHAYY